MWRTFSKYVLIALGVAAFQVVSAQELSEDLKKKADSILSMRPNSLGSFDDALEPYKDDSLYLKYFIAESEKDNQPEILSYTLNQLGTIQLETSEYQSAITYHRAALGAAIRADNAALKIHSLNHLGAAYFRTDSIKKSLDYYQEARLLGESLKDPSYEVSDEISRTLFGIGKIYHSMGQYTLANRLFNTSLNYFRESDNKEGLAATYKSIADCLEAKGMLDESMDNYQKSLSISKSLGAEGLVLSSKAGISHVLTHMDRAEEGLSLLEPVLEQAKMLGDEEILSLIHVQMGWVLSHLAQYERAKYHLLEGLDLARRQQITQYVYDSYFFLHDVLEAEGDYEMALASYKNAQSAKNRIANTTNRRYIYDALSKAEEAKWNSQIEILSQEAEIANLQLRKNRNTLLIGALLLVLFALMLYIIYRQYLQNNERKVMALEQSRLRSQMNPHFLFNSLNSIKHFIINNESKNAIHYLNKFSKLIRKILESSNTKEITLADELETVMLYMDIENIRFNDKVDFKVEIAPEINPATIKIPSLILQPFLENALWHGLSTKQGPKEVCLSIRQDSPGVISLIIQDNGIGREASRVLRQQKVLKRKSLGISNTKQRLTNFYRVYRNTFKILIEDLYKEDGTASGTSVQIEIPVI